MGTSMPGVLRRRGAQDHGVDPPMLGSGRKKSPGSEGVRRPSRMDAEWLPVSSALFVVGSEQAVQKTIFLAGRTRNSCRPDRPHEGASESERFERPLTARCDCTVQTLQERQQKIATARRRRDAFVSRSDGGAVMQVFRCRLGRVIERIELTTETAAATSDAEVLQASGSS